MSRKQPKRRAGRLAFVAIAGIFIVAIAGGVGFGAASADSSDDLLRAGAFGFDEATHAATQSNAERAPEPVPAISADIDAASLAATSQRDISAGLKMVDELQAVKAERDAVENAAAIERVESQKAMQGVVSVEPEVQEEESAPAMEYNLPAVDWSVGREAFIAGWADRIDAYLAGSPLSGYGSVFAEAAWENGVDPRWSPSISNTESTKGAHCFLPHNAWGWGSSSWSNWESAIREHVAGLAAGYGYSITFEAAQKYCPPNCVHWYNTTVSQMATI